MSTHITPSNLDLGIKCPASLQGSNPQGRPGFNPANHASYTLEGITAAKLAEELIEHYDRWNGNVGKIKWLGANNPKAVKIAPYASWMHSEIERLSKADNREPSWGTEKEMNLGGILGDGTTGRADFIAIGTTEAVIGDLKNGQGISVEAESENNPLTFHTQTAIYALRVLEVGKNIERVKICIAQPRLGTRSEITLTRDQLERWNRENLQPAIEYIRKHPEEVHSGRHCAFCEKNKRDQVCPHLMHEMLSLDPALFEIGTGADLTALLDRLTLTRMTLDKVSKILVKAISEGDMRADGYEFAENRERVVIDQSEAIRKVSEATGRNPEDLVQIIPISQIDAITGSTLRTAEILGDALGYKQKAPRLKRR